MSATFPAAKGTADRTAAPGATERVLRMAGVRRPLHDDIYSWPTMGHVAPPDDDLAS